MGLRSEIFRAVVRLRPTTYLVSCTMGVAGESDKMAAWLKVETELKQLVTRRGGKRQSTTETADVILKALSEEDLNNCCSLFHKLHTLKSELKDLNITMSAPKFLRPPLFFLLKKFPRGTMKLPRRNKKFP